MPNDADNHARALDDEFCARYPGSCRCLGVEPTPRDRTRELITERPAKIERDGEALH